MARTATMVPMIDDDGDGWNGVEAGGGLQGGDAVEEDEEGSASQAKKHNVAVFEPRRANATQMGGQQNGGGPADAENAGGALVNRKRFRKNACPLDVPKSAPVVWTPYIDHGDVEVRLTLFSPLSCSARSQPEVTFHPCDMKQSLSFSFSFVCFCCVGLTREYDIHTGNAEKAEQTLMCWERASRALTKDCVNNKIKRLRQ
jgi:hypothetical protein